jgi:hypothetical protein
MLENHYIRSKATQKVAKVQSIIEEEILSSQQGIKIYHQYLFCSKKRKTKVGKLVGWN